MSSNTKQLKRLEDVLSVSQTYIDQFNMLDVKQQGYLDENEAQLYFSSINFGKEFGLIWNSIHDMKDSGRLIMKQFIIVMFLAHYRHESISIDQDSTNRLTEFSQSLRHCEESLQEIEHYRFFSLVTLEELRRKFSQAFFEFEDMLRQLSKSDTSVVEKNQSTSPAQEKIMPGSFRDEKQVSKSVPKPMSLPQDNPGFLDQYHKEASTLTLRSQPISHKPYDRDDVLGESDVVQGSSIPDAILDIATSVTGLASLVGLSNSPKPETRSLDTTQETNQDTVKSSQAASLPIKPKEVDDTVSIDPPVDLNHSGTKKKLTDDELNQGADALKEMGQSIPVTRSSPSKYTDAQNNTNSSENDPSIENLNAIDTNIHDPTDDAIKARPELIQNEDGSFGYATIVIPGKEVSKDVLQGATKVRNDLDTCIPSNNASQEYLVIDSNDGNTGAAQTDDKTASQSDEIERLERGIEQQLDILSNSASSDSESSHHTSPTSENGKPAQLKSHIFQDKSTAEAIESLAKPPDTKRASMDGQERVLYVRDGFENFIGFGLKCLSKDRPSSI